MADGLLRDLLVSSGLFSYANHCGGIVFFFCFKQKTAYEMRISDWSSDVCSSDLQGVELAGELDALLLVQLARNRELDFAGKLRVLALLAGLLIGLAILDRKSVV